MTERLTRPSASAIRTQEARMLQARARGSAGTVFFVIALIVLSLSVAGLWKFALLWGTLACIMVAVTVIYADGYWHMPVAESDTLKYLRGHTVISGVIGLLWGGAAIQLADPGSEAKTMLSGIIVSSITAGGIMAGTVYRPGYLALAFCSLMPFTLYLLITMHGLLQVYGLFMGFYLYFCWTTNRSASAKTQDAIAAELSSEMAEAELVRYADKIRSHQNKERSVAAISHDMSQPLLAQRNLLSELARQLQGSDQEHLIQQIRMTQVSQESLVDEMSRASKRNAPTSPTISVINLHALCDQLDAEFAPQFAEAECRFDVDCSVDQLETTQAWLERIVRNLLSNAVKYGATGAAVTLSVSQMPDGVQIVVEDQGLGIDPADLPMLFEENERLPEHHHIDGSGLGLSIARRLARDMGGELTLQSVVGTGTKAILSLPHTTSDTRPFVLCIGASESPELGDWSALMTGWMWECVHADTPNDAAGLITALRLSPDLILWDLNENSDLDHASRIFETSPPIVQVLREETSIRSPAAASTLQAPWSEQSVRRVLEALVYSKANSRPR